MRQMSDCTWLIYDIMQTIDNQNFSGLLMLIDFEKAFDSISWHFLYKTLKFYGFSDNFIIWINFFNNGGHGGRVVTLSPPTSAGGVRSPSWP